MSTGVKRAVLTSLPRVAPGLKPGRGWQGLAGAPRCGDTAASCSVAVTARRIQWVNTPVLIEAMERHRQGLLPRPMQLWLTQLLDLPAGSAPPELPHGPEH